ncbi:MAG: ribosome small subunit-dependent GTPase A [Chloroflexi bacterium RBG_13_50_21]|nr:MAG: ribosome small subunit-dependent GTPase A [Chloroflexi bacterium RBG_13_50_21]
MHANAPNMYDGRPTFTGVVYKKTIGNYLVHTDGRALPCELSNRIRKQLIYPTADPGSLHHRVQKVVELEHMDPLAVGDEVRYIQAEDGKGLIIELLPRRNKLTRRSAVPKPLHHGAHPFEQIIVTNVDQVVPVLAAAQPDPKWNLLDRYLVSAEAAEIEALICITKLDLVKGTEGELQDALAEYRQIGYPSVLTSSVSGEGIDELRSLLKGRISVLVGKSGVGKTALLNALEPGLGLRVKEVNQVTGKGRHTTTNLEMFPLEGGGAIVDTPGTREFGMWDNVDDMAMLFSEMRPLVGKCRFGLDCQHDEEPGCAIRKAVMAGQINPRRYQSLLSLKEEVVNVRRNL